MRELTNDGFCLHGGPGIDHSPLKPLLAPLADIAQVVFLDQRCHGRSDLSTADRWNLSTWITDVASFCDVLGIEQPILFGHSFGGFVALGLAARYPELAAKLIVVSSAARVRYERSLEMFERLGGSEASEVAARYFRDHTPESIDAHIATCVPLHSPAPPDPEVAARMIRTPQVGLHFGDGELKGMNLFPEIGRIRCPTLIPRRRAGSDHTGLRSRRSRRCDPWLTSRSLSRGRSRRLSRSAQRSTRHHPRVRGPCDDC